MLYIDHCDMEMNVATIISVKLKGAGCLGFRFVGDEVTAGLNSLRAEQPFLSLSRLLHIGFWGKKIKLMKSYRLQNLFVYFLANIGLHFLSVCAEDCQPMVDCTF